MIYPVMSIVFDATAILKRNQFLHQTRTAICFFRSDQLFLFKMLLKFVVNVQDQKPENDRRHDQYRIQ